MRRPTIRDRLFQTWWRWSRSATLGVRGVVVDAKGHVLVLRHTYTPGWHFPGGGVERGENCALALRRELEEEAGILTTEADLRLVSVHANHAFFPNDHVLVYRVERWTQVEATQKGEIAEVKFVDPASLPPEVSGGTLRRINEIFGGKPQAVEW